MNLVLQKRKGVYISRVLILVVLLLFIIVAIVLGKINTEKQMNNNRENICLDDECNYVLTSYGIIYRNQGNVKYGMMKPKGCSANKVPMVENFTSNSSGGFGSGLSNVITNMMNGTSNNEGDRKMNGIKLIKIKSDVDGRTYQVRNFKNAKDAANMMARLNQDAKKLINHLKKNYPNHVYTKNLLKGYNYEITEETPKNMENLTSYTIDKSELHMCLREKEDPHHIHEYNLLLYVLIHEMAHMANHNSWGHDDEFYKTNKWMLKRADEINIIRRIDFEKNPQNFCGLDIKNNLDY